MSEYLGSFSRPTLSSTLLVILFIPAFASLAQLVLGSRLPPRVSRALTAVVLASTLGAVLIHVVVLARLPVAERSLMQHAWRMVRVGQLDAGVDLCFDPLSAVMSLIVTSVGVIVSVVAFFDQSSKAAPADPLASHGGRSDPRRRSGWLELIILMMLVVVLADNLVLLLVGWEGMAVAAWGLLSPPRGERFGLRGLVIHRAGAVALLAGVVTLYWGLGGAFEGTGYSPDLSPRFVAVRAAPERAAADAEEAGALTLTSYPGSTVYLDDARTPLAVSGVTDAALRAPFVRARVPLGPHSFRIHPGNSLDDYVVRLVSFAAGDDVVLTLLGPTVTFRQIEAQLELENVFGDRTHDEALRMRKLGGAGLVTVVCLLFTFAAFAKSAQFPMHTWLLDAASQDEGFSSVDGAAILCAATSLPAGVYLVARLAPIFATRLGVSKRSVSRWENDTTAVGPETLHEIAVVIAGHDMALAEELAELAQRIHVGLGYSAPLPPLPPLPGPPRPAPVAAPPPAASPPVVAGPTASHLADSVVCAAVDAGEISSHAVRTILLAALTRAEELNLDLRTLRRTLEDQTASRAARGPGS